MKVKVRPVNQFSRLIRAQPKPTGIDLTVHPERTSTASSGAIRVKQPATALVFMAVSAKLLRLLQ
jgi:hypothetical protein